MKTADARYLVYWLLAIAFAVAAMVIGEGESAGVIWVCLLVFYALLIRAARTPVAVEGGRVSHLKGDLLFLIFAYLILYLPYQLSVVGDLTLWYSRFVALTFVEQTNTSLLATTSGMLAFSGGVELARQRQRPSARRPRRAPVSRAYLDGLSVATAAIIAVLTAMYVTSGAMGALLASSYAGSTTNNRTEDGMYFLITLFTMLLAAVATYRRWQVKRFGLVGWIALAIVGAWSLCLLVLGDRNAFLLVGLVAASAASTLIIRIRRLTLVAGLVFALVGYNVVEAARQSEVRSLSALVVAATGYTTTSYSDSSFTNTTVTARAAFALVPEDYPYYLGKFKLIGFAGIVPFSRGLFVSREDPFVTSADLISNGVLGPHPTWSLGTNIIADIYVDFGVPFIPVLMAVAGLLLGMLMRRASEPGASFETHVMYFLSTAIFAELPRYAYDFPVRPLIWTLLFLALYRKLWKELSVPNR